MKHNLRRVLRLTEDRAPWVRAVRAWRTLLPDWTPSLDALKELDLRPHEHAAAVQVVADGWAPNDPRWDVLMALLEWERRQAAAQVTVANYFMEYKERTGEVKGFEPPEVVTQTYGDLLRIAEETEPVERKATVIPVKVVQNGRTVSESETTVETPLKALFLDKVTPVRHLREKQGGEA